MGFVDLLRTHGLVVLNLGESGQSSLLQLAAITEYLPRYAPKIVLWCFTEGMDLPDLYTESTHPLSRRYLEPEFTQRLLGRQPEIDDALRSVVSRIETRERDSHLTARQPAFVARTLAMVKLWNLRQKLGLAYGVERAEPPQRSLLETCAQSPGRYPGAGADGYQRMGWHALLRLSSQLDSISQQSRRC